ncbi:MAG: methyltransferase domain-containing protein [Patescibacteria group bacterium]
MVYDTVIINIPDILRRCNLRPGQIVADLGTGREGRFALAAGKVVGEYGKVYALDISKTLLPSIETKATMLGINNINTVWTDLEQVGASRDSIPDKSVDLAVVATILYQSKKQDKILEEGIRMMKDGAYMAVVDWITESTPFGPPTEIRVEPEKVIEICTQHGLILREEFPAGQYHYALIFQK